MGKPSKSALSKAGATLSSPSRHPLVRLSWQSSQPEPLMLETRLPAVAWTAHGATFGIEPCKLGGPALTGACSAPAFVGIAAADLTVSDAGEHSNPSCTARVPVLWNQWIMLTRARGT